MKILIADDHAMFREGIQHVIKDLAEHVEILEASNSEAALQHARQHSDIDLVLLDLNMPGKNGFAALDIFCEQYPTLPVVILSGSNLRSVVQRALDNGAMGFISKESSGSTMLNALRLVLSGEIYVPSSLVGHDNKQSNGQGSETLTPRQLDVLALLVEGCSNKIIAKRLGLAESTIKMHVTAIFRELNVNNRTQAAKAVENLGIDLPPTQ